MRRAERLRQLAGVRHTYNASHGSSQVASPLSSPQEHQACTEQLPGVTVVLPVKGCRKHNMSNWRSHLSVQYAGPLEFIFVVDSESDPAWQSLALLGSQVPGQVVVRRLVAGPATRCSQKIHNLVAGVHGASPASEFVLFLDDDVDLHPGCLTQLVSVMQAQPHLFMATGYPFDIPPANASLQTYCVLVYHLPLLIAFSVAQHTNFVWGGCMLLRCSQLRPVDAAGVLQAWCDGGYSDDLILAALCTEKGLPIAAPSFAVFPQWLEQQYSWSQYWNYLRRQLFVLDTYSNNHNRFLNHTMMVAHSWASAAFALPALSVLARTISLLVACGLRALAGDASTEMHSTAHHSTSDRWRLWWRWQSDSDMALLVFVVALMMAHATLLWMTGELLQLLLVLAPHRPLSASPRAHFSFIKLWAALLLESCLLPPCMAYTAWQPSVQWSGITYRKSGGKVVPMHTSHIKKQG